MGDLGLDPETVLKLMQMLLRGSAYLFAGFALLALSDRKSTRLNSSHIQKSRMPSSA